MICFNITLIADLSRSTTLLITQIEFQWFCCRLSSRRHTTPMLMFFGGSNSPNNRIRGILLHARNKKTTFCVCHIFFLTALLDNIKVYIPIFMLLNFRPFFIDAWIHQSVVKHETATSYVQRKRVLNSGRGGSVWLQFKRMRSKGERSGSPHSATLRSDKGFFFFVQILHPSIRMCQNGFWFFFLLSARYFAF